LIHAIGNHVLNDKSSASVKYIHAESYVSDVVRAYQSKSFEEFKKSKANREAAASAAEKEKLKEHTKGMTHTDSGLYYSIQKEGTGATPKSGKTVSVHYRGMLMDGTVFDSSYQRNQPIDFPLGEGRVIPGWDEGIALLKKGSVAKLVIPSELAYGAQGAGGVIPPNATLIFEVELVDFR